MEPQSEKPVQMGILVKRFFQWRIVNHLWFFVREIIVLDWITLYIISYNGIVPIYITRVFLNSWSSSFPSKTRSSWRVATGRVSGGRDGLSSAVPFNWWTSFTKMPIWSLMTSWLVRMVRITAKTVIRRYSLFSWSICIKKNYNFMFLACQFHFT